MNAGVVIERELRAESRGAANYWLRVLAAGAIILVFASLVLLKQIPAYLLGQVLFGVLTQTLSLACWILVPLMTADCISREQREGTLGLLFLTPLSALDVILGKGAAHILRVLALFVAALPVLGLPLVLGGVPWPAVFNAMVTQAGAVLLALSAGLYASTKGGTAVQAMVRAEGYSLLMAMVSKGVHLMWNFPLATPRGLFVNLAFGFAVDVGIFVFMLQQSAHQLRTHWQQESPAPERPPWVFLFASSEFWQSFFRWDKTRTLGRNPMVWLQEYSWTARLTKWGWLLFVLVADMILLVGFWRSVAWPAFLTAALALGIAFSAVSSFRRERQSGLLELLLVSPLTIRQLIYGRMWGIGCHYLPAVALLVVGWNGDRLLNPKFYRFEPWHWIFLNPLMLGSLAMVGLFLSLRPLNLLLSWFLTWLVGFVLPVWATLVLFRTARLAPLWAFGLPSAVLVVLMGILWMLLYRSLHARTFLQANL